MQKPHLFLSHYQRYIFLYDIFDCEEDGEDENADINDSKMIIRISHIYIFIHDWKLCFNRSRDTGGSYDRMGRASRDYVRRSK